MKCKEGILQKLLIPNKPQIHAHLHAQIYLTRFEAKKISSAKYAHKCPVKVSCVHS